MICEGGHNWILQRFAFVVLGMLWMIGIVSQSGFGQKDSKASSAQSTVGFEVSERESLAFVESHHPELVVLLQSLKSMRVREYEIAIREIGRNRKRLDSIAKRDNDSYQLELEAWKLQSKIDLLIAKGIAGDRAFEPNLLKELVKQQVENQKLRWRHEQVVLAKRQEQLNNFLMTTEGSEDEKIERKMLELNRRIESKSGKPKKPKQEAKTP